MPSPSRICDRSLVLSPFRPRHCALGTTRTSGHHVRTVLLYPLSYEGMYCSPPWWAESRDQESDLDLVITNDVLYH